MLLALLLCLAGSASAHAATGVADWTPGEALSPSKNRIGVSGPNPNPIIWDTSAAAQQGRGIGSPSMGGLAPGVRIGPNMYAYVRQNPWTKFDPHGLFEGTAITTTMPGADYFENPESMAQWERGTKIYAGVLVAYVAVPVAIEMGAVALGKEVLSEGASQATNGATDLLSLRGMVKGGWKKLKGLLKKGDASPSSTPDVDAPQTQAPEPKTSRTQQAETEAQVERVLHRKGDSPEAIENIQTTGELKGHPPKNVFRSDIPKVQAHDGPIPEGAVGFEFTTTATPSPGPPGGGLMSGTSFAPGNPGVKKLSDNTVKIDVKVTKVQQPKPKPLPKDTE